MRALKFDILYLIAFPLLASCIIWFFDPGYLFAIVLFYLLPSFYLFFRSPNVRRVKSVLFTLIVSTPFAIVVDHVGTVSDIWYVPKSLISNRFLGTIPWEDFVWMFAATFLCVTLYQTFSDKSSKKIVSRKIVPFIIGSSMVLIAFGLVYALSPEKLILNSPYAYLILGTIFFLLPTILLTIRHPKIFKKYLKIIPYFFYVTLLFEIFATEMNYWVFTGTYLMAPLTFFGLGFIALEELLFVGIVGPAAATVFYEQFDDDGK